jgi:hypothetical protein
MTAASRHRTSREREQAENRAAWWEFIRTSFLAAVGTGNVPNAADYDALPERQRAKARQIAETALDLFDEGEQGAARAYAEEWFRELVNEMPGRLAPPNTDETPQELARRVRRF